MREGSEVGMFTNLGLNSGGRGGTATQGAILGNVETYEAT